MFWLICVRVNLFTCMLCTLVTLHAICWALSMQKCKTIFFCCAFLQFWAFLLIFVTILARDHAKVWFYFKYAYLKEYISAFEKIPSFGHGVICPLTHCICRKNLNFGGLCLMMPSRSHDNLKHLLVLKVIFQNIYFLSCDLLGISVSFRHLLGTNEITCSFLIFSSHFYTYKTETITKACDLLETIRYCLLKF